MDSILIGPLCFGIVIGYVAYRSLARSGPTSSVSDLAAVVGAVGGGVITNLFLPGSNSFDNYAVGLLLGFPAYVLVALTLGPKVLHSSRGTITLGASNPTTSPGGRPRSDAEPEY